MAGTDPCALPRAPIHRLPWWQPVDIPPWPSGEKNGMVTQTCRLDYLVSFSVASGC